MAKAIRQRFPQNSEILSSAQMMNEYKYYVRTSVTKFGIQGLNHCMDRGGGIVIPNCTGYCYGRALEVWGLTSMPAGYSEFPYHNAHGWLDEVAVNHKDTMRYELPYLMKDKKKQYNPNVKSSDYARDESGNLIRNPNCVPRAGAIMVWRGGPGPSHAGHVAFVESVIDINLITQSYSGYSGPRYDTGPLDPLCYHSGSPTSHNYDYDTTNRLYNKMDGSHYYFLGYIYPPNGVVVRDYTYKLSFNGTDGKLLTATGKEWII